MIRELLLVYSNWRFWSFILIAFLPVWFGLIGCGYLWLKEIVNERIQRYAKKE